MRAALQLPIEGSRTGSRRPCWVTHQPSLRLRGRVLGYAPGAPGNGLRPRATSAAAASLARPPGACIRFARQLPKPRAWTGNGAHV